MSSEQNDAIISNDINDNSYEINKYFKMIYKPNENKKEKKEIIKKMIDEDGFEFNDEKETKEEVIRILGKYFVKQNKNKCKIIYNNKKYKLKEYFDEIDKNYKYNIEKIKLKLTGINNITNFEKMFYGCYHLSSVSESKNDIEQISTTIELFDSSSEINSCLLLFEEIEANNINERYINNPDFFYVLNKIHIPLLFF